MRLLRFGEHSWIEDNLSAYVDQRLSSREVQRLETHIAGCERCARGLAELRATVDAVRALPAMRAPRSFALGSEWARRPALRPLPARLEPAGFWRTGMGLQGGAIAAALLFVALIAADLITVRQPPSLDRSSRDELVAMATAAATTMPTTAPTAATNGAASPKSGITSTATQATEEFSTQAAPSTATSAPTSTGTPMAPATGSPTATSTQPPPAATTTPAATGTAPVQETLAPTSQAAADATLVGGSIGTPAALEEMTPAPATETPADRTARLTDTTPEPGLAPENAESPGGAGGAPQTPDTASDSRADEDGDGRIGWRIAQALAAAAAVGLAFLAIRRRREQSHGS